MCKKYSFSNAGNFENNVFEKVTISQRKTNKKEPLL